MEWIHKERPDPGRVDSCSLRSSSFHRNLASNSQIQAKNIHHRTKYFLPSQSGRLNCHKFIILVISLFVCLISNCRSTSQQQQQQQQNHCPKMCRCEDSTLEISCQEPYGAAGLPHTLNPSTKHMIINHANTSQFSQLDYLVKLETLDLAFNKFSTIDFNEISNNINLFSINASHNIISELKDSAVASALSSQLGFSNLASNDATQELSSLKLKRILVKDLVLSHNQLIILKDFIFVRWIKLQRLDLSHNQLISLDAHSLSGLNKLEVLNLRGNQLKQIPSPALQSSSRSLVQSSTIQSSLRYLDLSENTFSFVGPDSFHPLNKMQELLLESCHIEIIDEKAFESLNNLHSLSLTENNLAEVPTRSFAYIKALKLLKINSNKNINLMSRSFLHLKNLEELQINNCSFKELKGGTFHGLDSLKRLEIGNNSDLKSIERGTFASLPKLNYLSLYSDSISSMPDDFTNQLPRMPIIDLRFNPLICDCDLKWLTKWLIIFSETKKPPQEITVHSTQDGQKSNEILITPTEVPSTPELLDITCFGPTALSGRLISELPENKLECLEPSSDLNVNIGYAALFFITFVIGCVCILNFCRNKRYLFAKLKENLAHNQIPMMMPYSQDLPKNLTDMKKEGNTHLYGSDYEHVDAHEFSKVYTINEDQIMYCETQDIK